MTAYPGIWSDREYQAEFYPSERKKAKAEDFGAWLQDQPAATRDLIVPCKRDARWGKVRRIFSQWEVYYNKDGKRVLEEDPEGSKEIKKIQQKFLICLDPSSPFAGNIYNNDAKVIIYQKILLTTLYRPIHAVAYTLYNASLVHAAVIIFN